MGIPTASTVSANVPICVKKSQIITKILRPIQGVTKGGPIAYKLELPQNSRIHPTFHISFLMKKLGQGVEVQTELPSTLKEDDSLIPRPQAVLEQRKKKGST